jgi:hypothetical protein
LSFQWGPESDMGKMTLISSHFEMQNKNMTVKLISPFYEQAIMLILF